MTSTKESIRKEALTLFSQRGYGATSMNDIAQKVGIKKSSLYSHYSGKEEIFLAIYQELAEIYENLNKRLFEESEDKLFEEKLFHIFQGFIKYYYENKEFQAFWNQMTILAPPEIREKILPDLAKKDEYFHKKMIGIFQEGMEQGIITQGYPQKKVMSFRAMRDGVVAWLLLLPQLNEEWISDFWSDLWNGLQK